MSEATDTQSELLKLARVLGEDVNALRFLEPIGWADLRKFRHLVMDQFFEAAEDRLNRLAEATKFVPNPVILKLAPKHIDPRMAAALSGVVDSEKALKLIPKLPPAFLAEAYTYVDARRAANLIAKTPVETTRRFMPILLERGEYITVGQILQYLTPGALKGVLPDFDDRSVLRVLEVAEGTKPFETIFSLLSDSRLGRILQTAREADLLDVAVEMYAAIGAKPRIRMTNIVAQQSDAVLDGFIEAVYRSNHLGLLLPALLEVNPGNLHRFAQARAFRKQEVIAALMDAAIREDMVAALLPILPRLSERALTALAAAPRLQDHRVIGKIVSDSLVEKAFPETLVLFRRAGEDVRQTFADAVAELDAEKLEIAFEESFVAGRLPDLLAVVPMLPPETIVDMSAIVAEYSPKAMRTALVQASEQGTLPELFEIMAGMPIAAREKAISIITESASDDDLLGAALEPEEQQAVWNQLLRVAADVPLPLLEKLSHKAAFLPLESLLPSVLKAGELTNAWSASFAIVSGIHDRARREGVPVEFRIPLRLLQSAAARAAENEEFAERFWFAREVLSTFAHDPAVAAALDDAAIVTSEVIRGVAGSAVEISMGLVEDNANSLKILAGHLQSGNVTDAVTSAADVASGIAASLIGRARAAGKAINDIVKPTDKPDANE
ncbi:hypothetical protein [Smaragdicoccus niigatensis]|uniref:hypothetical protein n=1 Tax=Smaragdicoccus niigatensis TaxID=359359 RepID=UPI00037AEDFD|nr:hypothetical protein [Smaragdicoccus niigatensis]